MANPEEAANNKRKSEYEGGTGSSETQPKALKTSNEYQGFSFQKDSSLLKVDVVQEDLSKRDFFQRYISQRKPCVLSSLPALQNNQPIEITRPLLEEVAGDKTIQVEKRPHKDANFGQNRTAHRQVHLTIKEFLKKLLDGGNNKDDDGELYYWSTQEDTDDVFNIPCRQLVDHEKLPSALEWAGHLILSSCNLWMGQAKGGASSGLHHDYHDNFYFLLKGRKRFRLFSPDCAPHLATYGTIDRIHSNGRVSYVGNETRADGVPLASLEENEIDDDIDDEDEEEIVLGKGFDYVSENEEEGGGDFDETKDDFEEIMGDDSGQEEEEANTKPAAACATNDDKDHPDSFSRINPGRTDDKALQEEFPPFASCRQVMVELEAGQALYLPAGWFHEVTSYSSATSGDQEKDPSSLEGCHMALNYWYHPPDAVDDFANPYQHDFWKKEEEHRLKQQKQQEPKK